MTLVRELARRKLLTTLTVLTRGSCGHTVANVVITLEGGA